MKMTEGLIVCAILWIFLLEPAFGGEQNPTGGAPQNVEQKDQPGTSPKEIIKQPAGGSSATGEKQLSGPSVTEGKDLPQQTVEGNKGDRLATPSNDDESKDISIKAGSETSRDAQASGSEKAKEEEKAGQEKAPSKERPLDRRWFMKNTEQQGKSTSEKKPDPVKWKDETQKTRCQGYGEDLRTKYSKTQHYSVQGDVCRTAENAEAFLSLFAIFSRECPNEFVLQSGFSPTVKENVMRLKELGTKECLRGGGGRPR